MKTLSTQILDNNKKPNINTLHKNANHLLTKLDHLISDNEFYFLSTRKQRATTVLTHRFFSAKSFHTRLNIITYYYVQIKPFHHIRIFLINNTPLKVHNQVRMSVLSPIPCYKNRTCTAGTKTMAKFAILIVDTAIVNCSYFNLMK